MPSQVIPGLPAFQPSRLNELIDRALLTDYEAAKKVGVTYKTMRRWRSGEVEPRRPMVRRIAEAFDVDPLSFYNLDRDAA